MKLQTVGTIAEIIFGVLCAAGWLVGVIAWVRRGFGIPRPVHITAGVLVVVGLIVAAVTFAVGIRSVWFTVLAALGFPAWAYAGWFLMGCPGPDVKPHSSGYDISGVTKDKNK